MNKQVSIQGSRHPVDTCRVDAMSMLGSVTQHFGSNLEAQRRSMINREFMRSFLIFFDERWVRRALDILESEPEEALRLARQLFRSRMWPRCHGRRATSSFDSAAELDDAADASRLVVICLVCA